MAFWPTTETPFLSVWYQIAQRAIYNNKIFNVSHIDLQNFHYLAYAYKNQPCDIIDIIFTLILFIFCNYKIMSLHNVQAQTIFSKFSFLT